MTQIEKLNKVLSEIASYRGTLTRSSGEAELNRASTALAEAEKDLRERIQGNTAAQVKDVIDKLEAGEQLGQSDLDLIRLWMVADADFYVRVEKDFPKWVAELDRLLGVIDDLRRSELTPQVYGRLTGTVRDALRVISDMVYFKRQEERVKTFESATENLTRDDKRKLAEIMTRKLESQDF